MNNLWNFLTDKFPLLMDKIFEQIYLAGTALILAMLISIPLGIWIARKPRLRDYILAATGVMQTIPSLALLGFLLPLLGIGVKTAIVTLTVYALLPIVRNTVTGLLNVSPTYLEAADGLGFTTSQKMWYVELPLALPVIVAGIRTATAMSVGIATLAAFIGAGGLGDFIYEGLSLNSTPLILLGAIPAALLALALDFFISRIETMLIEQRRQRYVSKKLYFTLAVGSILILFLFLYKPLSGFFISEQPEKIRIATKNFSEQLLLGELMTQLIEAKTPLQVDRKFNLGGTLVAQQAMLNNQIDMYPEYTGTAYTLVLKQSALQNNLYAFVKNAYQNKFNIVWLKPFGFNNTNAIAVRQDFASLHRLKNISDLIPLAQNLTIGVPGDFMRREDGFLGLKKVYQLNFAHVRLMDPGLMYKAIKNKEVDVIMAFSTDGRITKFNLVLLNDDRKLFPQYAAAPLIRDQFLQKYPEVAKALDPLLGKINDAAMQNLNYQVDVLKKSPTEVARTYLRDEKLLE